MTDNTSSGISLTPTLPTLPSQTTTTGLSTVFTNTINSILSWEKMPLDQMTQDRDNLTKRRQAYQDIQTKLTTLQTATWSLMSGGFSVLEFGRSTTITPGTANTTVATATASDYAVTGNYNLAVTQLATPYIYASDASLPVSATDALNKSGTIILDGDGNRSTQILSDSGSVMNSVSLSSVPSGVTELSRDNYTIETRNYNGTNQFRIKNMNGDVVAVADKNATDNTLTTDWQTLTSGVYDTKRGFTIDFAGNVGASATIEYKPAGTTINVSTSDSLASIADRINYATQPDGHHIEATVVGNQLVFTGPTGVNNQIVFTDNVGLGFTQTQSGHNASFSINNIPLSRSSNTGITDAIHGASLNLAPDAEGKTASIQVTQNISAAQDAVNTFVDNFNGVLDFIDKNTTLTKSDTDQTYTRSALTNDTIFTDLRSSLLDKALGQYSNSGQYTMLSDIGLQMGDDLRLKVTDSSKLTDALKTHYNDVKSLLDSFSQSVNDTLKPYTSAVGYLQTTRNDLTSEFLDLSDKIQEFQTRMIKRKSDLETQYANLQEQLLEMQYTYQTWYAMYNNTVSTTSTTG